MERHHVHPTLPGLLRHRRLARPVCERLQTPLLRLVVEQPGPAALLRLGRRQRAPGFPAATASVIAARRQRAEAGDTSQKWIRITMKIWIKSPKPVTVTRASRLLPNLNPDPNPNPLLTSGF